MSRSRIVTRGGSSLLKKDLFNQALLLAAYIVLHVFPFLRIMLMHSKPPMQAGPIMADRTTHAVIALLSSGSVNSQNGIPRSGIRDFYTAIAARVMAYSLLSEISPASKHWTICARVSRLWEYRGNVDDAEIQHLDLVLVDEQGTSVYAEIPKEHVEAKRALLQEEHIYTFSRFLVSSNKMKYRPVDSEYMVEIGYYTEIEEKLDAPPNFPMYAYTLTPLENLDNYIGETRNFLDVIGVVKAVSNAASIQGSNQPSATTKRLVVIKDAKDCETTVTLWGQRAKDFDDEYVYEKGQNNPVAILFVGVLMKRYGQNEGLSGGPACRWYISPNIPETAAITASSQKNNLQPTFQPVSRIILRDPMRAAQITLKQHEDKTLKDILDINPFDFPRNGLECTVTISKLSPGQTWWFFSCNKCNKKSLPEGTSYRCSSCHCRAAKPRYKLCVIATDGTAEAEFILFGDIGQSVVGKQVGAVLRTSRGTDQIPPEIAQIVCTKYTWHISITEKSFHGPKKTFQVNRLITSFGRQPVIPRLYHSIHTTASDCRPAGYIENSPFEEPVAPEIMQHTPPSSTQLSITEGKKTRLTSCTWYNQLRSKKAL